MIRWEGGGSPRRRKSLAARRALARTANPPAADGAPDCALGTRLRHALPDRPRPAGDARRRA